MISVEKLKRKFKRGMDLADVLISEGGWRAFRTWRPFSVSCFRICHRLKEFGIPFETIVDGGANIGQFARASAETFPQAKVLSFEPLPEIAELLRRNLSDNPRFVVFEAALGRKDGSADLYRNLYSHSSSILPLHPEHNRIFPDTQNRSLSSLKVKLVKLDTVLRNEKIQKPMLLKLDVQGFELEALRGAAKSLGQTTAILLETTFAMLYDGEVSFTQIEEFLRRYGFRFIQPIDILEDGQNRIAQMDALFLKRK